MTKKLKSASRSIESQPKAAKGTKRGRNVEDDLDEDFQPTKKPKRINNDTEPEPRRTRGNKRKRNEEDGSVEDPEYVKRLKLTIEKLECELDTTKKNFESTKIRLEREIFETTMRHTKVAEEQCQLAEVQFLLDEKPLKYYFNDLQGKVGNFPYQYLVPKFKGENIPEHVEKMLKQVSERPFRKFIELEWHATLFFEALIWRFLCTEFLENPFKLWGEDAETGSVLGRIACK